MVLSLICQINLISAAVIVTVRHWITTCFVCHPCHECHANHQMTCHVNTLSFLQQSSMVNSTLKHTFSVFHMRSRSLLQCIGLLTDCSSNFPSFSIGFVLSSDYMDVVPVVLLLVIISLAPTTTHVSPIPL